MSRISITPDGAQVLGALLDKYYSAGNPCFRVDFCEDCSNEITKQCKHHKILLKLSQDLFKAGELRQAGEP
jgi:hypothetical protein